MRMNIFMAIKEWQQSRKKERKLNLILLEMIHYNIETFTH